MITFNRMNKRTRGFRGRCLNVALLAVVLIVVGVQLANPHSYLSEAVARIAKRATGPMQGLPASLASISCRRPSIAMGCTHV